MTRSKLRVGKIENVSGEVAIAGRDIIKNIKTIYQRALTAAEEAARARKLESKLLAQGVGSLAQNLSVQASAGAKSDNPYKGLLAYGLNEAEIFHGRKEAKRDLLNCIKQDSLTVLHAESGAGKSSLLQAGIAAQLIANGHLAICLRTHDTDPVDFVKQIFLPDLTQAPVLAKASLREFLRQVCAVLGPRVNLYLLLDQFEEFFHLLKKNERKPFLESLADCLNDPSLKVRWVLALRAEALSDLAELESFGITPFKNAYRLNRLSRLEAREAIIEPARRYGIGFEEALLDHILATLATHDEVLPTHLQLVCSALTDDPPEDKTLTLTYYTDHEGGTEWILRDYLKRELGHLPAGEQASALKILQALITADHQRAVKTYTEIIQELKIYGISRGQVNTILRRLIERRLLIMQSATVETYELAHDCLLHEIEIDTDIEKRKQAEELLHGGIKAWRRNHNLLLGREHVAAIEFEHRKLPLPLDEEKAEFLLLSASVNNKAPDPWLPALDEKTIGQIVSRFIKDRSSHDPVTRMIASRVLWTLRAYVPNAMVVPLYAQHALHRLLSILPVAILILVLLGFSYLWLSTSEISGWEPLYLEDPTGPPAAKLVLALNPDDPDEIYAASQLSGWVSGSEDGGVNWRITNVTDEGLIYGIAAARGTVYAVSDRSLFVSLDQGAHWSRRYTFSDLGIGELSAVTTNPQNTQQVFIGTSTGEIRTTSDSGTTWELLPKNYSGDSVRALVTNGRVVIVATDLGLWVYEIGQKTWNSISLLGCDGSADPADRVTALAMPLANDAGQIGIWAVIPGKGVCDSDYRNEFETSLLEEDVPYRNINSIAITGDPIRNRNIYLTAGEQFVRQRTWHWVDLEWWEIKISSIKAVFKF